MIPLTRRHNRAYYKWASGLRGFINLKNTQIIIIVRVLVLYLVQFFLTVGTGKKKSLRHGIHTNSIYNTTRYIRPTMLCV